MDFSAFTPTAAVLDAAYSFVTALDDVLAPVVGSASAAAAVILITMLVRSILVPVGVSQLRAEATRLRLAPRLGELQRKHGKNREVLQRKTMELYKSENASPLAGCLPTLLQVPVLSVVYGLFVLPVINGHANGLLAEQLLGVPLGMSLIPFLASTPAWPGVALFAGLVLIIATVAFLSRRIALARSTPLPDAAAPGIAAVLAWLPFLTVVVAVFVPLAATLYLTTTTSWTFIERQILRRVLSRPERERFVPAVGPRPPAT